MIATFSSILMSWKQIQFFEKSQPATNSGKLPAEITSNDIQTTCISRGLFLGDSQGQIHHLNKKFNCTLTFKAYTNSVLILKFVESKNILLSIGVDDTLVPILKVWNVENIAESAPILIRTTRITHGNKAFPVTVLEVLENMTQVAIGLENGIVILLRGNLSKDRHTNAKIVYDGNETITGLGFRDDGVDITLFICTTNQILSCMTSNASPNVEIVNLGKISSKIGTTIASPQRSNQEMVVAMQEAFYFYGIDGMGPCYIIPGEKENLIWYRGYLVCLSAEPTAQVGSSPLDNTELKGNSDAAKTLLTIYDIKSKSIAFKDDFGTRAFSPRAAKAVGETIKHVVSEWDSIIIVTQENKVYQLKEIELSRKLNLLFSQNYYELALDIVLQPSFSVSGLGKTKKTRELLEAIVSDPTHMSWSTIVQICKKYGDYLYSKQDFDQSIQQYIYTIGDLEPSYVVRKFLDAKRIQNLTTYLKSMHDRNVATGDHTTLLLNCFTKLNDLENLIQFIEASSTYDPETAIIACRGSGYFQQALRIASKFELHRWFIRILVEDLHHFDEAVSYLYNLNQAMLSLTLTQYGQLLVLKRPSKMTKLLLDKSNDILDNDFGEIISFYTANSGECITFLKGILSIRFGVDFENPKELPALDSNDAELLTNIMDVLIQQMLTMMKMEAKNENWTKQIINIIKYPGIVLDWENALFLFQSEHFLVGELIINEKLGLHLSSFNLLSERNDFESILKLCNDFGHQNLELWISAIHYCAQRRIFI